jgi:hypothetical protein
LHRKRNQRRLGVHRCCPGDLAWPSLVLITSSPRGWDFGTWSPTCAIQSF